MPAKNNYGFTLLEICVSGAVLSIAIICIMQLVSGYVNSLKKLSDLDTRDKVLQSIATTIRSTLGKQVLRETNTCVGTVCPDTLAFSGNYLGPIGTCRTCPGKARYEVSEATGLAGMYVVTIFLKIGTTVPETAYKFVASGL